MCRRMFLLIAVVVFLMSVGTAHALYINSVTDFSSTQPAKWDPGWHYAVLPNWGAQYHLALDDPTDTFYDIPAGGTIEEWPGMVVLNSYDSGAGQWKYTGWQGDSGSGMYSAAGFNGFEVKISATGQNYNTYDTGNAESSVRYWVSDIAQTVNVFASVTAWGGGGNMVSYSVRKVSYTSHVLGNYTQTDLGGAWEVTGTHSFTVTGVVMAAGDFIAKIVHQSGNIWDAPVIMHGDPMIITPEPATIALLGLGGLFLRRRKH